MFFSLGRSLKLSSSVKANPATDNAVGVDTVRLDLGIGAVPQQAAVG